MLAAVIASVLFFNLVKNYIMEVDVYQIGGRYGHQVWISEDSHKVLEITYEDPRSGGTIERSPDGITECDISFLKNHEPELYDEIMRVKNGKPHHKYRVVNNRGIYGDFEKWELEYEHNKKTFLIESARIEISKHKNRSTFSF